MSIETAPPAFAEVVALVGTAIGLAGVVVIAGGMLFATYRALRLPPDEHGNRYVRYRREVGQSILLGLEFLVAADIIQTVAVAPTIEKVIALGGIVLIRTFLSLALEVELTGRWPWRSAQEHQQSPPL